MTAPATSTSDSILAALQTFDKDIIITLAVPGFVLLILIEMVHDARIIPIVKSAADAKLSDGPIKKWLGDSVGWYEGDTLVVETTNVHPNQRSMITPTGKVTERFQRYANDEVDYSFTVEDPEKYSQPWTVENSFRPQKALYEYACHEGNYGMHGILAGAREKERQAAAVKTKSAKAKGGQ